MRARRRTSTIRLQSLRLRVMLLVLLVLGPAVPLLLYSSAELRAARVADAERNALRLARLASVEEDRLVEGARQLLTALARLPQVWQTQADCSPLFATLLPELPQYANLGAALPDGTIYCSAVPVERPVNIADRAYFAEALREKRFAVGTYRIGAISRAPTLALAYPVLDREGEALAVVYAGLDLAWLHELANGIELPPGGVVLVVERDGAIVAAQPPSIGPTGGTLASPALLAALRSSPEGTLRVDDLGGVDRIYGFLPLRAGSRQLALHVIVGLPAQEAFAEVDAVTRRSLLALGAFGALGLAAAWFGGQFLVLRPVRALARTAARLQRGDLGARTGVRQGTGELAALARSFDDMAASIETSSAALVTRAEELEAAAVENARLFRQLQETLWLREAFIGAAAHELRTPATSLKSYTQLLLRRGAHSEKERHTLTRMAGLADRAAHLARELEEAHALARGLELRYVPVELRAIVTDALAEVQARNERYSLMLCAGEAVEVEADAERLSMSVEALLENAIRYQPGGGTVRVTLARVDDRATVEVVDFGAGIPADRLRHVFEPLFEPWPPGSPHYTGVVGLGLYLARAVARAHGGEVKARSVEGRGSSFLLTLPQRRQDQAGR